jgi:hypothetical protein
MDQRSQKPISRTASLFRACGPIARAFGPRLGRIAEGDRRRVAALRAVSETRDKGARLYVVGEFRGETDVGFRAQGLQALFLSVAQWQRFDERRKRLFVYSATAGEILEAFVTTG